MYFISMGTMTVYKECSSPSFVRELAGTRYIPRGQIQRFVRPVRPGAYVTYTTTQGDSSRHPMHGSDVGYASAVAPGRFDANWAPRTCGLITRTSVLGEAMRSSLISWYECEDQITSRCRCVEWVLPDAAMQWDGFMSVAKTLTVCVDGAYPKLPSTAIAVSTLPCAQTT